MHIFTLLTFILASTSLCLSLPPLIETFSETNSTSIDAGPPVHVPVCYRKRGGFSLLQCARLLTGLKNLPTYTKEDIWSKFVAGESRLPAVFVQRDQAKSQSCYLTIDLYQDPKVPITSLERFSLQDEQNDLNRIYFDCLKNYGGYGISRIGTKGNVAALLGPQFAAEGIWDERFGGAFTDGSIQNATVVDLTQLNEVQAAKI